MPQNHSSKKTPGGFLYDPVYLLHDTGEYHPEIPERLTAIHNSLQQVSWFKDLHLLTAERASEEIVALAHGPDYIELVQEQCEAGYSVLSTGDTVIGPESYEVALKAVGGVTRTVDMVMGGQIKNAFCAVRPPGHHANSRRGMGFCVFNNIAIAARYAQKKHGVERVLIADWDVHHGNGTQDIFYDDNSVFFMSTHQSPWYPGTGAANETGADKGEGFTMNRPFWRGAGHDEIVPTFRDEFLKAARDFRPDLTLLSAGFDSHLNDPLGGFNLDDDSFRELTKIMLEIANISGEGRLISMLEGGYNLSSLASAVYAHMDELRQA